MAQTRRIIRIVGHSLDEAVANAAPVAAAIEADKTDGVEITVIDQSGPKLLPSFQQIPLAIQAAVAADEAPVIMINGHGINNGDDGRHVIDAALPNPRGILSPTVVTAESLAQMVKIYREAYKAKHGPNAEPPKMLIAVETCYGEGIIKSLSPEFLRQADILVYDSEQRVTYQDDTGKQLQDLALSQNPEEAFLRGLIGDTRSPEIYSLPALATQKGVLDGDRMRDKVTRVNLEQLKAGALANLARVPEPLRAQAKAEIGALTSDNFQSQGNEDTCALIGYLGDYEHRFTPLSTYADTARPLRQFLDPKTPERRLRPLIAALDEDSRAMLPSILQTGVADASEPRAMSDEKLAARYRALADSGVNIFFGPNVGAALKVLSPEEKDRYINQSINHLTPLMEAIELGQYQRVEQLIKAGADVNATNDLGETALHFAARYRGNDYIPMLLEAGANVNAVSLNGQRPLSVVGYASTARLLIAAGADIPAAAATAENPLVFAAATNQVEMMRSLIASGADVRYHNEANQTLLMIAAAASDDPAMVTLLVESGADVQARDKAGETALYYAKTAPVVRYLIAQGSDINSVSNDAVSPLRSAVEADDTEVAVALLQAGAEPNQVNRDGSTLLGVACMNDNLVVINALAAAGVDVDYDPDGDGTALYSNVGVAGKNEVSLALINAGADVNRATSDGVTPLMRAALSGNTDMVTILIARGADPRGIDRDGDGMVTPEEAKLAYIMQKIEGKLPTNISLALDANADGVATPEEVAIAMLKADVKLYELGSADEVAKAITYTVNDIANRPIQTR